MIDFPLMLWVKLPVVDRIDPQSNRFATSVENKTTVDSKLNDSPALLLRLPKSCCTFTSVSLCLRSAVFKTNSFVALFVISRPQIRYMMFCTQNELHLLLVR